MKVDLIESKPSASPKSLRLSLTKTPSAFVFNNIATLSVGIVAVTAFTEIVRTIRPLFLGKRRHFEAKDSLKESPVDNVTLILL
jgi:hypothetical protein